MHGWSIITEYICGDTISEKNKNIYIKRGSHYVVYFNENLRVIMKKSNVTFHNHGEKHAVSQDATSVYLVVAKLLVVQCFYMY